MNRIGLGTVQFGKPYGISNAAGQTSIQEVELILEEAKKAGIRFLDTAVNYGSSEEVLGQIASGKSNPNESTEQMPFDIVTKLSASDSIDDSLDRLNRNSIYAALAHSAQDLTHSKTGRQFYEKLLSAKDKGLVKKIGVSVYSDEEVDAVLELGPIDLVQIPFNVLDQRFVTNGTVKALKFSGIEIHSRSAFLQGLLLMKPEELSPYFESIREHLKRLQSYCKEQSLTPLQACLGFALSQSDIDVIIVGVNTKRQLVEILEDAKSFLSIQTLQTLKEFGIKDLHILNPSLWKNA